MAGPTRWCTIALSLPRCSRNIPTHGSESCQARCVSSTMHSPCAPTNRCAGPSTRRSRTFSTASSGTDCGLTTSATRQRSARSFETASISSNPPTVPRPVTGPGWLNFCGSILRGGFTLNEVYDSRVNNSSAVHHTVQVGMDLSYPALTGQCQVLLPDGDDLVRNDAFAGPCEVPFVFYRSAHTAR